MTDRFSFVYVERAKIHRDQNALTVVDEHGTVNLPAAAIGALLLGPGTNISHAAVALLGECGVCILWVGERGVRLYASGRPLAKNSHLLEAQARMFSNTRSRLEVARKMYGMRFPEEDVSTLTMKELRGREGARMRRAYRENAAEFGVEWHGRRYDPNDFDSSDPINQALTATSVSLYGVAHSVVTALGCSPGLGFVHSGNDLSFVYDIADLYKSELSIPTAFEVVANAPVDVPRASRMAMRDVIVEKKLLARCARDVTSLLAPDLDVEWEQIDTLGLWSGTGVEAVTAGKNWDL